MLGGNPEYLAKQKMTSDGYKHEIIVAATGFAQTDDPEIINAREEFSKLFERFREQTQKEKEEVKELGGLRILGTERHDSRRIDNQLRGRAGRQGDPGSSVFYLSLDDDIARIFGGERLKSLVNTLKVPEDMPISNKMFTNQIEKAQRRVEDQHYSVRKRVLSYDDVMNKQRDIIYTERDRVLSGENMHELILGMIPDVAANIVKTFADYEKDLKEWDYDGFNFELERVLLPAKTKLANIELAEVGSMEEITEVVTDKSVELYKKKAEALDKVFLEMTEDKLDFAEVERIVLLRHVDREWMDHIDAMDALRKGIWMRQLAQMDPVVAYTREGFEMFDMMNFNIKNNTVQELMKRDQFTLHRHQAVQGQAGMAGDGSSRKPIKKQPVRRDEKIGPNDQCPCNNGKKYKYCCGA
jgi:preprotein translocase subunit SecA